MIAGAVNVVHYIGIAAAKMNYDKSMIITVHNTISQEGAILYRMFMTALSLWIIFVIVIADLRRRFFETDALQKKLDKIALTLRRSEFTHELSESIFVSNGNEKCERKRYFRRG